MSQKCLICNGTEFEIEAGSCICVECGAHQLNFTELVEDEETSWEFNKKKFFTRVESTTLENKIKEEIQAGSTWASFEGFNIIIKTWTDILVHMGASEKFREAVFKLWVRYLQKREVAFLSPKESFGQGTEEEISVLAKRDVIALKKGIFEKKRKMEQLEPTDEGFVDNLKKKVERKFATKKGNMTKFIATQMSRTLDSTNFFEDGNMSDEANNNIEESHYGNLPLMTKEDETAFEFLLEDEESSENEEDGGKERIITFEEQRKYSIIYGNYKFSQTTLHLSPYFLTVDKAISFIYLGLLIAQEDVLLFELLRLFKEDYLPYQSALHLLEEEKEVTIGDNPQFMRCLPPGLLVRRYSAYFASLLNIQLLPLPSLEIIAKKLTERLQLPDSIYLLVIHTVRAYEWRKCRMLSVPSVEVSVGAVILLLFKIMYGLDDVHEELLSDFAEAVNDVLEVNKKSYRLFSWRRWTRYMNRLLHWEKEVCLAHIADKTTLACSDSGDVKRFSRYFWAQGVWKLPSHLGLCQSKASWDSALLQYALGLNLASKEHILNQKPLFKLCDRRERLALYVNEIHEIDPSKNSHSALQIANELLSVDFKNDKFNWLTCKVEVEKELLELGREVEIIPVKLSCQQTFPKSTCATAGKSRVSKLVVPDPHQSYWKMDQSLKISNSSNSFRFLLKLISQECETIQLDVLNEFAGYCKEYEKYCVTKFLKKEAA